MLLSSCVIWRHLEWDDFRAECPDGDEPLQRLIWERLDDALAWLVSLGAEPVWHDTENPLTTGKRFDPRALTELLARERRARDAARRGRGAAARARHRRLRASGSRVSAASSSARTRGARATALDWALARGAAASRGHRGEFYGRVMPAPPARIREEDFVPLAQLYGREARIFTDDGREITPAAVAWHENDLAQLIGPSAWYVVEEHERADRGRARRRRRGRRRATTARIAVHVAAAGDAHDRRPPRRRASARVAGLDGIWAAGVDAGGVASGGYASGLAQALVLGLAAAEVAARGR